MADVLLVVAIKTDQPNIQRRMNMILAAAAPVKDPPDTEACAWAKATDELRASDLDRLASIVGWDAVRRLNVGDVMAS